MRFMNKVVLLIRLCISVMFIAAGLTIWGILLHVLQTGDQSRELITILSFMGTAFFGIGLGSTWWVRRQMRAVRRRAILRKQHPESPWLWRDDWARGRIRSSATSTMMIVWPAALLWNGLTFVTMSMAWDDLSRDLFQRKNPMALIALLFPLVGMGLVLWAIRATLQWRKYGVSVFEMASVPGILGGSLRGVVRTRVPLWPERGIHATLACIRQITIGSGRERRTTEYILWQDERIIGRDDIIRDPAESLIPIAFDIPSSPPATDDERPGGRILWRLSVTAKVPGVDYCAHFEVPVFATASSQAMTLDADVPLPHRPELESPTRSPHTPIRLGPTTGGGMMFVFPPRWSPKIVLLLLVVLLGWSGILTLIWRSGAPLLVIIVAGVFDILLVFALLITFFRSDRVTIEGDTVRIEHRFLGLKIARTMPCHQITDVRPLPISRLGNTSYYNIRIITASGEQVETGHSITDWQEARWVADRMKRYILDHTTVSAA